MATFVANFSISDPHSDGSIFFPNTDPVFVEDGDTGDAALFEPGETLFINNTVTASYVGTVTINGEIFIVVDFGGFYELYGNVADPNTFNPGATYDIGSINSAAVDPNLVCFAPGTLIATPEGERAVERLHIGDLIRTADGRSVPVKWIGRQTVQTFFAGERARPVRVAAGALGNGLPHSDLVITADHALILDGLAITAGALVNGTTITLDPLAALPDRVTYYHVETEGHEVILANGAAAETFVDYAGRKVFDNHADYVALYGDARTSVEMPLPRVVTARLVPPSIRARLQGSRAA